MRWLPALIFGQVFEGLGGCLVTIFGLIVLAGIVCGLYMVFAKLIFTLIIIIAIAIPLYLGARFLYRRGIRNFGDDED
ncbi:hypothetical protein [Lactococcus petauri]|uniref:Uncharacterized protein n=1 Tax=Lactococcus petauri TaxID=1940789 RepID=A0A252CA79_9LACT|nr:hypothetical protein [Lactococcus petauri]OUK02203.1 hypothetical protein BZZ03_11410 [Lactococcus petauri]